MHMTFKQLCNLVLEHRRKLVERLKPSDTGTPLNGHFRSRDQKELIGCALHDFAAVYGPIQINGMTVGVSPSTQGFGGLRSTDSVKFRVLIKRLQDEAMAGFEADIIARWREIKEASGVLRSQHRNTEAERFSGQTFRGFD